MKKKSKGPLIGDKSNQLFRDSEMIDRKKASQSDFEESVRGEIANKIISACEMGVQSSANQIRSTKPSFQNRNFKANLVNSNIQGFLTEAFPFDSGFCRGKRFFVKVNEQRLFCKKVDKRLNPSNIQTKTVIMYNDQLSDDASDTMPITIIGYQVSDSYTELIGIYAVHMSGGGKEWRVNLYDLRDDTCNIDNSIPMMNEDLSLDVAVKPKAVIGLKKAE